MCRMPDQGLKGWMAVPGSSMAPAWNKTAFKAGLPIDAVWTPTQPGQYELRVTTRYEHRFDTHAQK